LNSWPSAAVKTSKLDLSTSKETKYNALGIYNRKEFENLADNTYAVPRNPIIKILFCCYLFVYPYKDSFSELIQNEDVNGMKKLLQPVFNSKIVSKDEGLLSLMRKYDDVPFKS